MVSYTPPLEFPSPSFSIAQSPPLVQRVASKQPRRSAERPLAVTLARGHLTSAGESARWGRWLPARRLGAGRRLLFWGAKGVTDTPLSRPGGGMHHGLKLWGRSR